MKAILVVDVDEKHMLLEFNDLYDRMNGRKCTLVPMPSYKAVDLNDTRDVVMFCHGWNTCLNEITGETE